MCTWPFGWLLMPGWKRCKAELQTLARMCGRVYRNEWEPASFRGNPSRAPEHGFNDYSRGIRRIRGELSTIHDPATKPSNPTGFPPKTHLFDENTTTHLSIRYRASWDGGYCDPSEISASSELPEISDSSMRAYQQASIPARQHSDYSIQQASMPAFRLQHTAYRLQHTAS